MPDADTPPPSTAASTPPSTPPSTAASTPRAKNADVGIDDVIETVKAYARQELVGPLRGVGQWIAYGVLGALALGIGLLYVLVGLLRLLQTEWERSASGSLSWLAYLITLAVAILLLALTISRVKKSTLGNEPSSN